MEAQTRTESLRVHREKTTLRFWERYKRVNIFQWSDYKRLQPPNYLENSISSRERTAEEIRNLFRNSGPFEPRPRVFFHLRRRHSETYPSMEIPRMAIPAISLTSIANHWLYQKIELQ